MTPDCQRDPRIQASLWLPETATPLAAEAIRWGSLFDFILTLSDT